MNQLFITINIVCFFLFYFKIIPYDKKHVCKLTDLERSRDLDRPRDLYENKCISRNPDFHPLFGPRLSRSWFKKNCEK